MAFCSNCGKENDDSSNFCINCGSKLIIKSIKCSKCGKINESGSNFCVSCGNKLNQSKIKKSSYNEPKKEITLKKSKIFNKKNNQQSEKVKFSEEQRERILKAKVQDNIRVKVGYLSIIIDTSEMANHIRDFQEIAKINEPCEAHEFVTRNEEFNSKLEMYTKLVNNQIKEYESLFKKIIENEEMASRLKYRSNEEELEAIKLYEENISYGICCNSFVELSSLYNQRKEFDRGIEITEKGLKLFKESGNPTRQLEQYLTYLQDNKSRNSFMSNHQLALKLEEEGKIDEAIELHLKNTELDLDYIHPHTFLARLYHYKKDFEKEQEIYKIAIAREEKIQAESEYYNPSIKMRYEKDLENVESYLNTGKWKYDCLPSDPKPLYYQIKEAKTLLKSEDKQKGIDMLEEIMENGSYNNTVYNTLYQTYNKDKKFDDSIRVCKKAIEVLGLFSNDRKQRWEENLDKAIKRKEKLKK